MWCRIAYLTNHIVFARDICAGIDYDTEALRATDIDAGSAAHASARDFNSLRV